MLGTLPPLDLALLEAHAKWEIKRQLRQETVAEARSRTLEIWQTEWDNSEHGRYTHAILPNIVERLDMQHLQAHYGLTQLLTGHGAFKSYLHKHGKAENTSCDDCGLDDTPDHAILFCPAYEDIRFPLRDLCEQLNIEWPPTLPQLLQTREATNLVSLTWLEIKGLRGL